MWVANDSLLSKEYTRKYRQLLGALRHEDNHELRMQILTGQTEPLAVASLKPHQLAPKTKQEKKEEQIKQYFESKIKLDDGDGDVGGKMVVKTDQGLEFIDKNTKLPVNDSESRDPSALKQQSATQPSAAVDDPEVIKTKEKPPKTEFGMPREVYEMYLDLEEKWSIDKLTLRLKDRINEHLRFNTITRDNMLKQVDTIAMQSRTTDIQQQATQAAQK